MEEDDNHTEVDEGDDDDFNKSRDNIKSKEGRFTDRFFTKETQKKDDGFIGNDQRPGSQQPRGPKLMKANQF